MTKKMEFPSPDAWYHHYVSYGETDTMGVLYYAEYLHLFERARGHLIREQGISYAEVERRGVILPVREAQCRYRVPVRYDDEIFVRVGIGEFKRASMKFVYELWNADKTVLHATGMTEHACLDPEGKLFRTPDWLVGMFRK